jgi:hypothetical protein
MIMHPHHPNNQITLHLRNNFIKLYFTPLLNKMSSHLQIHRRVLLYQDGIIGPIELPHSGYSIHLSLI